MRFPAQSLSAPGGDNGAKRSLALQGHVVDTRGRHDVSGQSCHVSAPAAGEVQTGWGPVSPHRLQAGLTWINRGAAPNATMSRPATGSDAPGNGAMASRSMQ